jgi:hypothetical protein
MGNTYSLAKDYPFKGVPRSNVESKIDKTLMAYKNHEETLGAFLARQVLLEFLYLAKNRFLIHLGSVPVGTAMPSIYAHVLNRIFWYGTWDLEKNDIIFYDVFVKKNIG